MRMHRKVLFIWYAFTHSMNFLLLFVAVMFRGNHGQLKQIALTFRTCQRKIAACNSRIGKFDFGFLFSEKVFLRRELLNQILNEQFTRFNFITLIFGFLIQILSKNEY